MIIQIVIELINKQYWPDFINITRLKFLRENKIILRPLKKYKNQIKEEKMKKFRNHSKRDYTNYLMILNFRVNQILKIL